MQHFVSASWFSDAELRNDHSVRYVVSLGDSIMPVPPPCSGSMGLGFAPTGQTTNLPFWRAILEGKDIASPEFSIWLSHNGGTLTFGGVNNTLFSGDIEYLALADTNATYWALEISGAALNNVLTTSRPHISQPSPCKAIPSAFRTRGWP